MKRDGSPLNGKIALLNGECIISHGRIVAFSDTRVRIIQTIRTELPNEENLRTLYSSLISEGPYKGNMVHVFDDELTFYDSDINMYNKKLPLI